MKRKESLFTPQNLLKTLKVVTVYVKEWMTPKFLV